MDDRHKQNILDPLPNLLKQVRNRARESEDVMVGMSGGVESLVATVLALKALGAEKGFGLILPDSSVTPKGY